MEAPRKIITQKQFSDKLDALQTLFEVDLERVLKAIHQAKADGKTPIGIMLPAVKFCGLPIQLSDKVTKPQILAV